MPHDVELTFPPSEEPPELLSEADLRARCARKLRVPLETLGFARVLRVSFDARRRHRLWRVVARVGEPGEPAPPPVATTPPTIARPPEGAPRVAIVGGGPAGLFCALDCLAAGLNVTLLERGKDVRARRKSLQLLNRGEGVERDSNYCFGEGGAGTYSDGKLYARSGKKRDVRAVIETLVAHGAPEAILTSWRPHIGSNRLPDVVQALRRSLLEAGADVRFRARAEELLVAPGSAPPRVAGVRVRDLESDALSDVACSAVVLATGHSALDALLMARRAGARLEPKGFAMGVRVEHGQRWLDERQYGGLRGDCDLPASFYELAEQQEGRGVYSFCMCPGGFVVPTTTAPERVVVNGMSLARRDSPFANSGLVVQLEPEDWCGASARAWGLDALLERAHAAGADLGEGYAGIPERPEDDPLLGVRLQLALETQAARLGGGGNRAPVQRADAFAAGDGGTPPALEASYRPGLTPVDLAALLPRGILERLRAGVRAFDARLPGFASEHGQLIGVESRTSSPVRVARDRETLESPTLGGLYPSGEGAGFAGGIVSAAIDGRRVAAALAGALRP